MGDFTKTIGDLHRVLILVSAGILAFSLSGDNTEDLKLVQDALYTLKGIDAASYALAVQKQAKGVSLEAVREATPEGQRSLGCVKASGAALVQSMTAVVLPDFERDSIKTSLRYLAEGEIYQIRLSDAEIANQLAAVKWDCASLERQPVVSVGVDSDDIDVVGAAAPQLRAVPKKLVLSSRDGQPTIDEKRATIAATLSELTLFRAKHPDGGAVAVPLNASDAHWIYTVVPDPLVAYPDEEAARYPGGARIRHAAAVLADFPELIGDRSMTAAEEAVRAEMGKQRKYPSLFGLEIRSTHGGWAAPLATLCLMIFLSVHIGAYRRRLRSAPAEPDDFISILAFDDRGSAAIRVATLVLLPVLANGMLAIRLTSYSTLLMVVSGLLCLSISIVGISMLRSLASLRAEIADRHQVPEKPSLEQILRS
jgi:hypothetical protein